MKKIIVVGGGIAGLSAGIYARQSGFDVVIYEMHSIPGGNSTSWRRKGYLFEGGMHWLVGSGEETPLHSVWREVGALKDNNPVYNRDPFLTCMDSRGPSVCTEIRTGFADIYRRFLPKTKRRPYSWRGISRPSAGFPCR